MERERDAWRAEALARREALSACLIEMPRATFKQPVS
jgi:hypothetical protein